MLNLLFDIPVCRKWKNICQNIWSRKQSLILKNYLEFENFEALLARYGSNLTTLSYTVTQFYICSDCSEKHHIPEDFYVNFNDMIIRPIIARCPNLTELTLNGLNKVKPSVLKMLANTSFIANLRSLDLSRKYFFLMSVYLFKCKFFIF